MIDGWVTQVRQGAIEVSDGDGTDVELQGVGRAVGLHHVALMQASRLEGVPACNPSTDKHRRLTLRQPVPDYLVG